MTARELKEFLDKLPPEQLELPVYYFVEYGGYEAEAYQVRSAPEDSEKLRGWTYPPRVFIS